MSEIVLSDIYGTKAVITFSRSGYIRIDFESNSEADDPAKTKKFVFSMNTNQATILMAALAQMLDEHEATWG